MEYYNFISCKQQLNAFIDHILPPLTKDEVIVVMLAMRKKYAPHVVMHKELLRREVVTDKAALCATIHQFNCQYGAYQNSQGQNIPPNACVIYCTINPRSTVKATKNLITTHSEFLFDLAMNPKDDMWKTARNIQKKVISEVQKARSKKHYIDIDFDLVDKKQGIHYLKRFLEFIQGSQYHLIETRGGYHVLLHTKTIPSHVGKKLYHHLQILNEEGVKEWGKKFEIIINRQDMIPLPGTTQGGFAVRVIDNIDEEII